MWKHPDTFSYFPLYFDNRDGKTSHFFLFPCPRQSDILINDYPRHIEQNMHLKTITNPAKSSLAQIAPCIFHPAPGKFFTSPRATTACVSSRIRQTREKLERVRCTRPKVRPTFLRTAQPRGKRWYRWIVRSAAYTAERKKAERRVLERGKKHNEEALPSVKSRELLRVARAAAETQWALSSFLVASAIISVSGLRPPREQLVRPPIIRASFLFFVCGGPRARELGEF